MAVWSIFHPAQQLNNLHVGKQSLSRKFLVLIICNVFLYFSVRGNFTCSLEDWSTYEAIHLKQFIYGIWSHDNVINNLIFLGSFNFFKVALSGLRQFLVSESPLKIIKKCFLFHLKSSFRSKDILVFVLTFWSCIETVWLKR